jgi:hypothetical protein
VQKNSPEILATSAVHRPDKTRLQIKSFCKIQAGFYTDQKKSARQFSFALDVLVIFPPLTTYLAQCFCATTTNTDGFLLKKLQGKQRTKKK